LDWSHISLSLKINPFRCRELAPDNDLESLYFATRASQTNALTSERNFTDMRTFTTRADSTSKSFQPRLLPSATL
jgi:hypothetical protein